MRETSACGIRSYSLTMKRFLAVPFLVMLVVGPARAHDFWIEPSSFTPAPGELVPITLLVGQNLEGDTVPRNDALIERFAVVDAQGDSPVVGHDGQDPAGLIRREGVGGAIVAYRSLRSRVELDAAKFDAYLDLEGLPKVQAGPEAFSRCAKALVAVGGKGSSAFTRPVGLKLEIVPEADPYALAPKAPLSVRVLYEGKPLKNVMVIAFDRASASQPQRIRTDAAGRARVALPRQGLWLIKAVHMIAAPPAAGARWESFWASLTFKR